MEDLLQALRATGEATRLRIVAVLARTELTVSELCQVLGQTQPRVSRHLKLLCDAGVLQRHAQGTRAYFRPARTGLGRAVFDAIVPLIANDDPDLRRDMRRLGTIRDDRAASASLYFAGIAADWDRMRTLHVADETVEAAMLAAVGHLDIGDLLDVGTGTGRVLEVFAPRIQRGLGLDLSQPMLDVARSRLDTPEFGHCAVRSGDIYRLNVDPGAFDVAVLHHVLHFLDDPSGAIAEVASAVGANGRLLIVDFAPHSHESMRDDYAHHWLGFDDDEIAEWCFAAGFVDVSVEHLRRSDGTGDELLTTTIWCATQSADAPSLRNFDLKAAS